MGAFGAIAEGGCQRKTGGVCGEGHRAVHGSGAGALRLAGERALHIKVVTGYRVSAWCSVTRPLRVDGGCAADRWSTGFRKGKRRRMRALGAIRERGGQGEIRGVCGEGHGAVEGGGRGHLGLAGQRPFLVEFEAGNRQACRGRVSGPLGMDSVRGGCKTMSRQAAEQGEEKIKYGTLHGGLLAKGFRRLVLLPLLLHSVCHGLFCLFFLFIQYDNEMGRVR